MQPEYHKGEMCPYAERTGRAPLLCQEGFCNRCQIWHDFSMAIHDEIVNLRKTGLTYAKIGRRLGITKEGARRIVKGKPTRNKPDLDSRVMLTAREVGQLLGIHGNTVRRWSKKGMLKSYRIGPRGDRRFHREDIDSFLKEAEIE